MLSAFLYEGVEKMNGISALIIGNVKIPVAYKGYTYSRNKIHSKNTGRTNTGNMVGSILAIKDKIEVTTTPLTPTQAKAIDDVFSDKDNMFQTVKAMFVDGTQKEVTAYFGENITYNWIGTSISGDGLIEPVRIGIIQQ